MMVDMLFVYTFFLKVDCSLALLAFWSRGLQHEMNLVEILCVQVGIVPAIKKLKDDLPNVKLAVSLHAPIQDIRCQIMPAASAFPLQRLMDALHLYQEKWCNSDVV